MDAFGIPDVPLHELQYSPQGPASFLHRKGLSSPNPHGVCSIRTDETAPRDFFLSGDQSSASWIGGGEAVDETAEGRPLVVAHLHKRAKQPLRRVPLCLQQGIDPAPAGRFLSHRNISPVPLSAIPGVHGIPGTPISASAPSARAPLFSIREIAAPDTPISRPNSTWLIFRTFLTLYSRLFIVASPFLARALRGGSPAGFASFGRRHPNSPVGMPIAKPPLSGSILTPCIVLVKGNLVYIITKSIYCAAILAIVIFL